MLGAKCPTKGKASRASKAGERNSSPQHHRHSRGDDGLAGMLHGQSPAGVVVHRFVGAKRDCLTSPMHACVHAGTRCSATGGEASASQALRPDRTASKPSTNMTTSTARKETATGCLRRGGLQTPRRCTQSQSSSCWRWPAARFWCACWAMPQQQQRATIARAHPSARLPTWTQLRLSPAMMALLPTCWCWALAAAEQLSSSAVATTCWSPRTACT